MCLKEKVVDLEAQKEVAKQILQTCDEIERLLKGTQEEDNFYKYEVVRQEGIYNMLDPKARELTGLTKEEYSYIINNYNELMTKYPRVKDLATTTIQYMKSAKIAKFISQNGCKNCIEIVNRKLDVKVEDLCAECQAKLLPLSRIKDI